MKRYFLILVFLVSALVSSAQGFEFGVKGGFNLANVSNMHGDSKLSFQAGTFQRFLFNEHVGMQVDLLYSRLGYKAASKHWERANYLNIPVLANVYLFNRFTLDFGPQVGILLKAVSKRKNGDTITISKNKRANDLSLGLAMGLSYEFIGGILASIRYNVGLTNVYEKKVINTSNKHEVFEFSIGYRLDL